MAITFFDRASNPAVDNTDSGTRATVTITEPASMVANQLVYSIAHSRSAALTWTMGVDGGQAWTLGTNTNTAARGSTRAAWCVFDGTWDASLRWDHGGGAGIQCQASMWVFNPTAVGATWAVDVAEVATDAAAPGGSFDVTITGQTPIASNTVTVAAWTSVDDNTWALQTAGWTNPGGVTQVRELGGSDSSVSGAYLIQTSAVATGDVTNRQVTNGGDAGAQRIITFSSTAAAVAATRSPMYARRRGR